jgi:hypothetical protein
MRHLMCAGTDVTHEHTTAADSQVHMKRARTTIRRGQRHWRGRGALHARGQRPPCSVLQQRRDLRGRAPALRLLVDVALCCSGDGRVHSSCSGRQGFDGFDCGGRLCGRQRLEGRRVLGQRRRCSSCCGSHRLRCSGCLLQVTMEARLCVSSIMSCRPDQDDSSSADPQHCPLKGAAIQWKDVPPRMKGAAHREGAMQGGLQLLVGSLLVRQPQLPQVLALPPHPLQPLRRRLRPLLQLQEGRSVAYASVPKGCGGLYSP